MTTARVVRGTKYRVLQYILAVVVIIGVIVYYNNVLNQLEDSRKANEICHQQEENLTTELQVVSEYKQHLEMSLKTEKGQKSQLEEKLKGTEAENNNLKNEIKQLKENLSSETRKNKEAEALKEEQSKTQEEQSNKITELEKSIKTIMEENKKLAEDKDHLRSSIMELRDTKEKIQQQYENIKNDPAALKDKINHLELVNHVMKKDLKKLKDKCPMEGLSGIENDELNLQNQNSRNVLAAPIDNKEASPNTNNVASEGSLNGARPLKIPTVTPKTNQDKANVMPLPIPYRNMPDGVVKMNPAPELDQKKIEKNEVQDNRYQNEIDEQEKDKVKTSNEAREVFDGQNDGLGFDFNLRGIKPAQGQREEVNPAQEKVAENNLDHPEEIEPEEAGEDRGEDDDQDVDGIYPKQQRKEKDAIVRN